jgi:dihydropteroate synthase
MGILNVTPDSFWDGGRYIEVREALKRAERLLEEGADILDVGAESTRPGAEPVPKEEELRRLLPILKEVVKWGIIISVDTYKRDVARECLSMGVHMINDVKALRDEGMAECVAEHGAAVVLMHMRGEPKTMQKDVEYTDVVSQLLDYLKERVDYAQSKGIRRECIVIDPGIGFGKRLLHNLQLLARLGEFKIIERPIMIGVSRKSFIGEVLNLPVEERLEGTLAAVAVAVMKGANILRVHDVKEAKRVIQIVKAIKGVYEGE